MVVMMIMMMMIIMMMNDDHQLTDGRDGRHDLSQLQLVEDGGLTSCIKTH